MQAPSEFVEESDVDYQKVFAGGGANCGDEDFAVFGCPYCRHVYLMEYEVDTVFTDARDLKKRIPVYESGFACVACGKDMPDGAWIGPKAKKEFRVRYDDMLKSDWSWILKNRV